MPRYIRLLYNGFKTDSKKSMLSGIIGKGYNIFKMFDQET